MLIRIGPGGGLIGTLIPMSTGLAALSQGDMSKLSSELVLAFTTTVVGLAIGTDEVKAGLSAWSQQGPTCRRVYDEILRSYPRAELALADYYLRQFHLPKPKANNLAKWVLDIAFRANYSFPNGSDYFRYDNVNTNPWTDDYKH
jgi:hypothetical protein